MSKKILVVDDDLFLRELYEEVLTTEGYEVEMARDGEEGLAKLQKGGYDLVLLDVMLPKLDGINILTTLVKNPPAEKNGPILLLTNLMHDPIMKDAKSKGATAAITKADITPADLLAQVKKYLN